MDSYYSPPRNASNNHRHSTPLSPLREIPKYNGPQDTNYIGITITDQEDTTKDLNTAWPRPSLQTTGEGSLSQSYRHSFNGFGDLSNMQQTGSWDTQPYHDHLSYRSQQQQQLQRQQQHQQQQLEQQQQLDQQQYRQGRLNMDKTSGLSRHASITLPPINTNTRPPHPRLSTSTKALLSDGPRSATLPLQHQPTLLSPTFGLSQQPAATSSSLINRLSQPNLSSTATGPNSSAMDVSTNSDEPLSAAAALPTSYFNSNHQHHRHTLQPPSTPTSPFSPMKTHFAHSALKTTDGSSTSPQQRTNLDLCMSNSGATRPRAHSSVVSTSSAVSGAFRKVSSRSSRKDPISLSTPHSNSSIKPLLSMTKHLNDTYQKCNQGFQYSSSRNPRRVLTKPSKPGGNDGYDNDDFDYILYVNDILGSADGHRYIILDVLGAGTFGQVVKCKNMKTQEMVAVKVVKNKLAYFKQSMMEVTILEMLNQRYDANDQHHILRLKDNFIHRKHLCLVFELMSVNLYELIKQNQFRGLSTNLVRVFTAQILDSLTVLNEARIIHCDLKPENILLRNLESPTIKVIDFGSACHEVQTMYTYIQSRFYRSPEVLMGLPYTSAIDMWSLGCIAAELFLGLPLFPGSSEYNQVSRIIDMLGLPPTYMIEMGKNSHRYFDRRVDDQGQKHYRLRSMEQYAAEQGKQEQPSKRYFTASTLLELITTYPMVRKDSMSPKELEKGIALDEDKGVIANMYSFRTETQSRLAFVDFLQGLLNLNHFERWSPQQAKQHPFITGDRFNGRFTPPFIPRSQSSMKIPLPMPHASVDQLDLSAPPYHHHHHQVHQQHLHQQPSQFLLSAGDYMDESYQHTHDSQQAYLTPAYSSLPDFYTGNQPPMPLQQSHLSSLSQDDRTSAQYHDGLADSKSKSLNNLSKRSSYTLPRVLEPPSDQFNAEVSMESSRLPSLPLYQHPNNQGHDHQHQSLSTASINGRPRANTVGTMQVPPPIHLASLDAVNNNTEGRKLGSIRERNLQLSELDSPSSSPLLQQQQQNQRPRFLDTGYTDFHGINALDSYHSSGHGNNDSMGGSSSLAPSSSISATIPTFNHTIPTFQPLSSSSHPINIRASTSTSTSMTTPATSNHHNYYSSGSDRDADLFPADSSTQPSPHKLQYAYHQQQQRHRRHRQQNRPSTWRSSIGNMPTIDLERDADWTEERNSPPLDTSLSFQQYPPDASSLTSPLPFANMTLQNSTSTSHHRSANEHHQHHPQQHRRSHSSVRFSDVMPPISPPSTTNTSSSILSRSSVASNVASLHRRVRGHPPLIQPYHRQDLEWDGVHSIPSYQQLQQQQQVHLPSFHHMATNDLDNS